MDGYEVDDLVQNLTGELVAPLLGKNLPVIINGLIFFTDGTVLRFTDNTVIYFGE